MSVNSEQSASIRVFDEYGTLTQTALTGTAVVVQTATRVQSGLNVFVEVSGV